MDRVPGGVRAFTCPDCSALVPFESTRCLVSDTDALPMFARTEAAKRRLLYQLDATVHPWEDWAETFAHYLHIRDTEQTAAACGLVVEGPDDAEAPPEAPLEAVPSEQPATFDEIVETWLPLTYALNAVNRSMGAPDLYPFVLAPKVLTKLRFVHDLVTAHIPYRAPAPAPA